MNEEVSRYDTTVIIEGIVRNNSKEAEHRAVSEYLGRYKGKLVRAAERAMRRLDLTGTHCDAEGLVDVALTETIKLAREGAIVCADRHSFMMFVIRRMELDIGNIARGARATKRGWRRITELTRTHEATSARPSPEARVDLEDELEEILRLLPDETSREIIRMRIAGHSNAEIGAHLGLARRSIERKLEQIEAIARVKLDTPESHGSERG